MITMTFINIFLSLKNPCTILLAKEKAWKRIINIELSDCKIVQKNKLCHSKQRSIGYLMIYDAI